MGFQVEKEWGRSSGLVLFKEILKFKEDKEEKEEAVSYVC